MTDYEQAKHEGIWQFVSECDAYRVRLICLTGGRRSSMLKRELDPLELQAREWAQSASERDLGNCKQQAYEILLALFAPVQAPADLAPMLAQMQAVPSDYDDSEQALGKQRAAQLERMRERDLSDV